ncbi:MAG: isopentenyl-diphosphate Delta-isomerase [Woeseia sp.]
MAKQQIHVKDAVVSDEGERLVLVDESDKPIGYASKAHCHDGEGQLHRAFSLFVVDGKGQVLMQQRSSQKRLWPTYWSNSCCSHPRQGETMETATRRRLEQELGISCDLKYLFKFRYQEQYGDEGSEHEFCWVYLGRSDDPVQPNRNEIASWCFMKPSTLDRLLYEHPQWFTPWFRMEWRRILSHYREELEALTDDAGWRAAATARLAG